MPCGADQQRAKILCAGGPRASNELPEGGDSRESFSALDINRIPMKGFVKPGEAMLLRNGKLTRKQIATKRFATCMFEYVYFSRPDTNLDAGSVYEIRVRLGELLARDAPAKADIVVPVPDTARP